jgi:hypothetical protein
VAQKDFLKGLTKEQVAALGLGPETASQIAALQDVSMAPLEATPEVLPKTGSYSQDQIGKQMQADIASQYSSVPDQNLSMAQADPAAFQAMNAGMQTAGMQPAELPAPLQQIQNPQAAEQQAVEQMMADQQAQQAVTREVATQKATAMQAAKTAEEDTKKAEAMQVQDAQDEATINKDLKSDAPNLGSQIGQAIAIMMGAYSQGLTGSKDNPGLVAIEKQAEKIAAARKYNDEQKLKLAEMLYKQGQQQIERQKNTVDSMIGLKKLEQADQEIGLKLEEINMKRRERMLASKTTFTKDELKMLPAEQREKMNLVRLPDGTFGAVIGADPKEVVKVNVDTDSAINTAGQLLKEIEYFGNNPAKKLLSRERIGRAKGLAIALTGQLRLPYMGPGALTDQERQVLESISGDPTKFFSLGSANKAKLQTVVDKVKHYRRSYLRNSGIDLPKSRNEANVEAMLKAAPGLTKEEAVEALIRKGPPYWNNEE